MPVYVSNGDGGNDAKDYQELPADGKKNVPSYEVPWGYYSFTRGSKVPACVSTSSINSCFAYISRWNNGECLFFAHVFSDGETLDIIRALITPTINDLKKLSCIAVVGMNPQPPSTLNRIQNIIEVSGVPHKVFRAPTGCVTYRPATGAVQCEQSTVPTVEVKGATKALFKGPRQPLWPMPDSEKLMDGHLGMRKLKTLVKAPKNWSSAMD